VCAAALEFLQDLPGSVEVGFWEASHRCETGWRQNLFAFVFRGGIRMVQHLLLFAMFLFRGFRLGE